MEHSDKFKLFGKWFWIGVVVAFLNSLAGLIYGVALVLEPEHRKEGAILIAWTVLVAVVITIVLKVVYPEAKLF